MSRARLLRDLRDMYQDAYSLTGSLSPEECDAMREQHNLTLKILKTIIRRTSGEAVTDLYRRAREVKGDLT